MDPYTFSLALGAVGTAAMAVIGLSSHAHSHGHSHGHGHAHGGHGHNGHGHGDHSHHAAQAANQSALFHVLAIVSPRLWFTLLAGFGAAGILIRPLVAVEPLRAILAVVGALAFERLLVRPLWTFAFRFASQPATTLEGCLTDVVPAVTGFDRNGHGLVAIELDGQVVQILATLCAADRAAGVRVRAGDRVRVEEVDAARNRCVVSMLGS